MTNPERLQLSTKFWSGGAGPVTLNDDAFETAGIDPELLPGLDAGPCKVMVLPVRKCPGFCRTALTIKHDT